MRINEVINPLKKFIATVRVNSTQAKTMIDAVSANHARLLIGHLYGSNNVISVTEVKGSVIDEGTKTLSSQELQVKSLADQEAKLKQQKKQLVARQALTKAQVKMRDASAPLSVQS